jgi:prepilin signal peptidase PulO-like enzyme (type II secretory pathway)
MTPLSLVLVLLTGFAVGLSLGSFHANMGVRLSQLYYGSYRERQDSIYNILTTPSHCRACGEPLGRRDLIPFFSWLGLRGRCRFCTSPISPLYPVVELFWGLYTLLLVWLWAVKSLSLLMLGFYLLQGGLLTWIAIIDYRKLHITNALVFALMLLHLPLWLDSFVLQTSSSFAGLVSAPGSAVLLTLILILLYVLLPGKMGFADIKFFFAVSLGLSLLQGLLLFITSSLFGLVSIIVYSSIHRQSPRGLRIPFITCLTLALFLLQIFHLTGIVPHNLLFP